MNHIKLFEAFEGKMSPEEYEQEIDNILQGGGDHLEIVRKLTDLNREHDYVKRDREYGIKLKKVGEWADSLSDEQKDELRAAKEERDEAIRGGFWPGSPEDIKLFRKTREDAKRREETAAAERGAITAKRNATITSKRSDILDRFAAGEITKEEALASL